MLQAILNVLLSLVIAGLLIIVLMNDHITTRKIDEMNKQLQVINQLLFSDNI